MQDEPMIPPEPGQLPTPDHPDPSPEREPDGPPAVAPEDRGAAGRHAGRDNIREGRVDGLMDTPGSTHGQGQGG
jgi:hypothetical protein